MKTWLVATLAAGLASVADLSGQEPLFEDLPFGVFVEKCQLIPAQQTDAIGQKLGGDIKRLTNSILKIHGTPIRVNVIEATTEADAETLHRAILGMKSNKVFAVREGRTVVEYPGNDTPAATAIKASWELGLVPKPRKVSYRVVAEIATVEKSDYMASNELFNLLISPPFKAGDTATMAKARSLAEGFEFGKSLFLRKSILPDPDRSSRSGVWPTPSGHGAFRFPFTELEQVAGIPFATVTLNVNANSSGVSEPHGATGDSLLKATRHWPVDHSEIQSLAEKITSGKLSDREKIQAILEWLAPGKNLKYAGKTGSRWGVEKVLEQKFGHCWDSSDVFVTLARAAGVPSRQVAGWLFGSSGHVWAEYLEDGKWQQVDPTGAGKLDCGIYHLPWFTTEDGHMPILYVSMPKIDIVSTE